MDSYAWNFFVADLLFGGDCDCTHHTSGLIALHDLVGDADAVKRTVKAAASSFGKVETANLLAVAGSYWNAPPEECMTQYVWDQLQHAV